MVYTEIAVCKHVEYGERADVLFGSSEGTQTATCFECADALNDLDPQQASVLLVGICKEHAKSVGLPTVLPGPLGFYDSELILRQPADAVPNA
jgi:hypothetical protein